MACRYAFDESFVCGWMPKRKRRRKAGSSFRFVQHLRFLNGIILLKEIPAAPGSISKPRFAEQVSIAANRDSIAILYSKKTHGDSHVKAGARR